MIRCPDNMVDRDIAKWVISVFIRNGQPYRYDAVENGVVYAHKVGATRYERETFPATECYAHWPALGCFNVRDTRMAVSITRRTQRLWTRSLSADMIEVKPLDTLNTYRYGLRSGDYLEVPYTHDAFLSPDEALAAITAGTRDSAAITRRIAVGAGLCTYKTSLFIDGALAGTVSDRLINVHSADWLPLVTKTFGEGYAIREA